MTKSEDAVTERLTALQREAPESAALIAAYDRNEDLIQALIAARQARRISQRELAEKMGTSQSVVVNLEAGRSDPRLSTIARYASALQKLVDWQLTHGDTYSSNGAPGIDALAHPSEAKDY